MITASKTNSIAPFAGKVPGRYYAQALFHFVAKEPRFFVRNRLLYSHIAGSSNGRTAPSGGVYPGSNPGPAAAILEPKFIIPQLCFRILGMTKISCITFVDNSAHRG